MSNLFCLATEYKNKAAVKKEYPGCVVVVVCGGWMVFDSNADYQKWKNQK
jgi:hypothetical protein